MGIATAAVYADQDRDAPHVRDADVAVALGGQSAAETYLDIEKLIAAAKRVGADAVHPGYGFLAENAGFARAVIQAGLTWVGPSPESIAAMGDKIEAKRLVAKAGVPLLAGQELDRLFAVQRAGSFRHHRQAAGRRIHGSRVRVSVGEGPERRGRHDRLPGRSSMGFRRIGWRGPRRRSACRS